MIEELQSSKNKKQRERAGDGREIMVRLKYPNLGTGI